MADQTRALRAQIDRQQIELDRQKKLIDELLMRSRIPEQDAKGIRAGQTQQNIDQISPRLTGPVGEAPDDLPARPEAVALPEGVGVLTPKGRSILDPSFDVTLGSDNRLIFRGVEIVTGVQVGVLQASDVDRTTLSATLAGRYGLSDRAEVEVRVPYVHRDDEFTTLVQRDTQVTSTSSLQADDIGDVEVTGRYQLNRPSNGNPIFVGNLRYKSNTGTGPFDVARDEMGVASELPTGSGFWALEPSVTMLYPSDPTVIFANIGYLYHADDDINQSINAAQIGNVDPGDSINAGAGFGFSVNPRFSFSLGYRHSFILPTKTEVNGTVQESDSLNAGALQFGWSYLLSEKVTFNNSFEFGVTRDAPDLRIVFRLPIMP